MALSCCNQLSALLKGITSNHSGDFYCIYCLHSFRIKNKLKQYKNVCENYDYCHIEIPKESKKILNCNQGEKSIKAPFVIYADLECLIKKNKHLL